MAWLAVPLSVRVFVHLHLPARNSQFSFLEAEEGGPFHLRAPFRAFLGRVQRELLLRFEGHVSLGHWVLVVEASDVLVPFGKLKRLREGVAGCCIVGGAVLAGARE